MAFQAVGHVRGPYGRAVPLRDVSSGTTAWPLVDILCTTGCEISMTLTDESLSWSRRQRIKAFKAALDAEYAEMLVAGTMPR